MSAVGYTNIPDSQKQHIKDAMKGIKEKMTPTLDSFKMSQRKVVGGQRGYQIPFFSTYYSGNSAITPDDSSFRQSNPPESVSMWVGLAYAAKVVQTQGMLLNDMTQKQSLVKETTLKSMAIEDFMKHQEYYAIGDGSGALAYVTSVAGGTLTCHTAAQTTPGHTKGAHRLRKNNTYDIVDESSGAVVGTVTPTRDGTRSATVPVTSTGLPNNSNAYVVEQGHYNKVARGLGYLISDQSRTFQGLDTTNYTEFINSVVDLNGSAITSATIGTLKNKVQVRANDDETGMGMVGHIPFGLFHTLAIQGYSARQYQASKGENTTSFGEPTKYEDGDTLWVKAADMDEDRVYLRRPQDYFMFEARPFGTVDEDGQSKRQSSGANDVGAWEYYGQELWVYNLGFDGEETGGNDASAFIERAAVTSGLTQVTA
jgi:hypothetical protein